MRIPAVVVVPVTLSSLVMAMAACLREPAPASQAVVRGHEESIWPAANAAPPVPQTAAAPSKPRLPLPGCRSIEERLASIVKSAPDAVAHAPAVAAQDYVGWFNRHYGTRLAADAVAIVTSSLWGDNALVLFERKGCETGTEQIEIMAPSPG
ncbi:MAG TPA: hypothetical protein VEC60_09505 [Reyranella sp.]|nr:hypothetical protein [Reyranella sp.]